MLRVVLMVCVGFFWLLLSAAALAAGKDNVSLAYTVIANIWFVGSIVRREGGQ